MALELTLENEMQKWEMPRHATFDRKNHSSHKLKRIKLQGLKPDLLREKEINMIQRLDFQKKIKSNPIQFSW